MKVSFKGSRAIQRGRTIPGYSIPPELETLPLERLALVDGAVIDIATLTRVFVDDAGRKHAGRDDPDWDEVESTWNTPLVRGTDGHWRPRSEEESVESARRAAVARFSDRVERIRHAIAGTSSAVKLAEYADKAAHAQAIIDGGGTAAMRAEATAEIGRYDGSDTPEDAARVWLDRAEALRAARTDLNAQEREALDAFDRRRSTGGMEEAEAEANAALDAWLQARGA